MTTKYDSLHIESITETAEAAFWAEVVRLVPEATTGDLSPLATHAFQTAAENAIAEWIANNVRTCFPERAVKILTDADGEIGRSFDAFMEDTGGGTMVCAVYLTKDGLGVDRASDNAFAWIWVTDGGDLDHPGMFTVGRYRGWVDMDEGEIEFISPEGLFECVEAAAEALYKEWQQHEEGRAEALRKARWALAVGLRGKDVAVVLSEADARRLWNHVMGETVVPDDDPFWDRVRFAVEGALPDAE